MFLVDDDEPEICHGREQRAARTYDDMRPALANEVPLIEALARRKTRMQNRDVIRKASPEPAHRLGREGYLGNEHDGGLSRLQGLVNGAQVHLGLARARDAIEHDDVGSRFTGGSRVNRGKGMLLALRELVGGTACAMYGRHGAAHVPAVLDAHDTPLLEGFERRVDVAEECGQLHDTHATARKRLEDAVALLRRFWRARNPTPPR